MTTPMMPSPTIKPDASKTPSCLVASGFGVRSARLIEKPTDDCSDDNHQRALRRQINSKTHRQRRNAHVFGRASQNFVEHNNSDADQCTDSDQTPIDVCRRSRLANDEIKPA